VRKALQTRPFDVVLALRLLKPAGTFTILAEQLAASPSQVYAAAKRLELAGLLRAGERATNPRALLDFLLGGVRYAFPVQRGALTEGIPTAHSAAPLNTLVDAIEVLVWPAPKLSGVVRGFGITPLYPRAVHLRERSPETYQLLTLDDALRLGDARLRTHARTVLERLVAT
jgi:DNA-binding Lrp family transcriptional regulator